MFLNLTLVQQMFFFFLALFLIQLVFCILAKLKLMPVLIYLACANLIFPDWVDAHPVPYWVALAGLILLTILSWVGPRLVEYIEARKLIRQIADQAHMARELGYQDGEFHFVVEDGMAKIRFVE